MSLEQTDNESAQHAVAPRVTLESMKSKIDSAYYGTANTLEDAQNGGVTKLANKHLPLLTICVLQMENGFTVVGSSACASPENFDAEYGKQLAYEDAMRQLWRLEGYALRNELSKQ